MKQMFKEIKHDLPASIVVFFVALPLCLGIALASGAPLFSGIIAGVVGGILVGFLSGSNLGVSGPAAGLAIIVLSSIASLGSWEIFLLAVVIAGVLQLIMGFAKVGFIAYFFPSSVIKGMLTAIGLIIVLKQIPHALGWDKDAEGDYSFFQADGQNTFSEILKALDFITPAALILSVISLGILILWEVVLSKKHKIFGIINGPLVVVFFGIFFNYLMLNGIIPMSLGADHLVNIPVSRNMTDFVNLFTFPDFSHILNPKVWKVAFVIAIVGSLETLLSVEATDKIDPYKRITPTNRELKAQGVGNVFSGLIGGLPITQVIIRSSANISFGGKTKTSAILHGIFLLISALSIASLLNMIPLASLAAILLVVGFKLAKPALFRKMYQLGWEQFIPFIVTVLAILFTDLLQGIVAGMIVGILFVLRHSYRNSHDMKEIILKDESHNVYHLAFAEEVSFFNKANVIQELELIPPNSKVVIDCSKTKSMDFDVAELINDYESNAKNKNIEIEKINFFEPESFLINKKVDTLTEEIQKSISPAIALEILKEGNKRFVNNLKVNRNLLQQANETSDSQHPFAVILSCIDSRTSAELIFDQGLGDIFSVRVAGNIVNEDILGSMEFGCKVAGSKIIVVLGHTKCGAIKGACDGVELGNLTSLISKINPAVLAETETKFDRNSSNLTFVEHVSTINVKRTVDEIMAKSPILNEMIQNGEIGIVGGTHDITTGRVTFYEDTIH